MERIKLPALMIVLSFFIAGLVVVGINMIRTLTLDISTVSEQMVIMNRHMDSIQFDANQMVQGIHALDQNTQSVAKSAASMANAVENINRSVYAMSVNANRMAYTTHRMRRNIGQIAAPFQMFDQMAAPIKMFRSMMPF